jgi:hypothetical protein
MESTKRVSALAALMLLLNSFGSSPAQLSASESQAAQSGTVVLAVDLRELTSLRDVPRVGDVFFRRIERQSRANDEYDLAIRGSATAEWKGVFGGADDNRAPHAFAVEPGTYVIDKINIGGGMTTIGPGIDAQSHTPRFGSFVVRGGEVLNLGRLVVHMHWQEGYFGAKVGDNTAEARKILVDSNQDLAARLQTRLLSVVPRFAFQMSGGRL